jgi:hypothetical protein
MTASRPVEGVRRLMIVWIALVALLFQSFVTQTHIHQPAKLASAARSLANASPTISAERPAPGHSSCPLCIELKIAGHYMQPTPVVLLTPLALSFWFYPPVPLAASRPQPSHHWLSRAPPTNA